MNDPSQAEHCWAIRVWTNCASAAPLPTRL